MRWRRDGSVWQTSFAALVVILVGVTALPTAAADPADHGMLVPESVRTDVPVVLDGEVHAHAQIGSRIVVGGVFSQVQLPDTSIVAVSNIFAYDINTGALDSGFDPVVNNKVFSISVAPDQQSLYIGGKFTRVDGVFRARIAKLTPSGDLVTAFKANANAEVYSLAASSDRVFAGGYFLQVNTDSRLGLAAVDATTGDVDPGFVMDLTTPLRGFRATNLAVLLSPDGNTLYSVQNARHIAGQLRAGVAKIDISGPTATLSGWGSDLYANAPCVAITDGALSPDGSFVVVSSWFGDNPPGCDTVTRFNTGGDVFVDRQWTARMYSSVFSVAVSDTAVFAAGHFCAAPRNPIPLGGISSTNPQTFNQCDDPAAIDPDNAVPRNQIAALHPDHGQALDWDPGSNAFTAGHDLTVVERGLLYGQDRDKVNGTVVGRSGFFDLGAPVLIPSGAGQSEAELGELLVPISLSKPWHSDITVNWETLDVPDAGFATPDVDFVASSGQVTFAAGETTKTVPITVIDDADIEAPLIWGEWLLVRFFDPSPNAVIDQSFLGLGIGVILDDDVID